jgi:hypothetical protein
MTITEAVSDTYLKSTGKPTPPAAGTRKYNQIIGLLDYYQRRWAREPGVNWNSLYDPAFSLGNVTATDTFDLDTSSIRNLSTKLGDAVRIVWTNGTSYTDYDLISHDALSGFSSGVTRQSPIGTYATRMGNTLVFNHTFVSGNSQFGGEIFVPAYIFPDEINADNPDTDEVQVDDPDWLVTRVAAEYVRNDITRRQRYPELLAEANEIMQRMIDDNDGQISFVDMPWQPGIGGNSGWGGANSDW